MFMNSNKNYPITKFQLSPSKGGRLTNRLEGLATIDSHGTIEYNITELSKVDTATLYVVAINLPLDLKAYLPVNLTKVVPKKISRPAVLKKIKKQNIAKL